MFSVLGMEFFAYIKWQPGVGIDRNMNFMSFSNAIFTLYSAGTG